MEDSKPGAKASPSQPQRDHDPQHSDYSGLLGWYERTLRKFKILSSLIVLLPIYCVGVTCFGLALVPGALLIDWGNQHFHASSFALKGLIFGILGGLGYLFFGFTLMIILPTLNFIFRAYPTPWRGPYYSLHTIRWALHNVLTYMMRFTFLEFLTPTPFNILFYRMMGMKIGKNAHINTTHISDPCLIEIGDRVTLGGSATIVAHYGQGGYLVISRVKIGNSVTIGLRAIIMGDVEIGDHAKILPNSVVMPKSRIPAHEIWGGIPARRVQDLLKQKAS